MTFKNLKTVNGHKTAYYTVRQLKNTHLAVILYVRYCLYDLTYVGTIPSRKQDEELLISPFTKRILIVDNDPDITLTFKKAFEEVNRISANKNSFHVSTYNDPLLALSQLKPDFYDLMLVDINMPKMNGFDFCVRL